MQTCSHVRSPKLVLVSSIYCHVRASSTRGCAPVHFRVQHCIEYNGTASLFKSRMSESKCKSSGSDVAGTVLYD